MPRKSRDCYLSNFYHVMIQGDEKKFVFKTDSYKEKIVSLIKKNAVRNNIDIVAYCIMNNHAHILIFCENLKDLSKMMSQCNTSYGLYYSKKRGCVGHVFRERYRSEAIVSKYHLINCIKYIHENPVKAKIVSRCGAYMHSSYNEYINRSGVVSEKLLKLCEITEDEYMKIINEKFTELKYIDEVENVEKIFEEIKLRFDIDNITNEELVKIYEEMFEKCNITKTHLANLLNIHRKKLSRILCKYGLEKER